MFGNDENQDQNQHNNMPADSAPLADPASSTPSGSPDQTAAEGISLVSAPTPVTITPLSSPGPAADTPAANDLLDIKQQALQHLSPLVGQLDQSPEEKFRTTMMMIQASDDQNLVKDAFESAKQITDDKTRAQALLDVINEINYFTQQQKG